MSRTGMIIGSIIAVGLIGLGIFQLMPPAEEGDTETASSGTEASSSGSVAAPAAGAVSVSAEAAHLGELIMRITANGVAESQQLLDISAEVAGKIGRVPVVQGQRVEAGDLLVELDDTELVMARDQAQEAYQNRIMNFANNQIEVPGTQAERDAQDDRENALDFLRRYINDQAFETMLRQPDLEERLSELTRADLFAALAELTDRRVALERAELNLTRAKVYAPFGGQVAGLEASSGPNSTSWPVVGQQVGAGTGLMQLVDADPIHVRVEVIESEISFVRQGRRAEVVFPAYPGEVFSGTIEAIAPLVDATRKTLSVTVRLANNDGRLKPGMFAQVVLDTEIHQDRLLVPVNAVLIRTNRQLVFVVRGGRAEWVYVDTGLQNEQWVEVLSDELHEGDVVVTSGHFTLAHNTPVNIINPEPDSEGGS